MILVVIFNTGKVQAVSEVTSDSSYTLATDNLDLTITINCVPRYYLEPNNLIYIDDKQSKIRGDFVITQYTLPLTYNGNMSITANEALTRV